VHIDSYKLGVDIVTRSRFIMSMQVYVNILVAGASFVTTYIHIFTKFL
jgi:hypothetical protein